MIEIIKSLSFVLKLFLKKRTNQIKLDNKYTDLYRKFQFKFYDTRYSKF